MSLETFVIFSFKLLYLAILPTSGLLTSPCKTQEPLANSAAESAASALMIIYPPMVSLISPKGPLVTTLFGLIAMASSKDTLLP